MKRPNILFIMTDDQAFWTLGKSGFPDAHTPALDRLAEQGVWLHNLFANAPLCSPSRGSLLTGLYPTQAGFGPDGEVWLADKQRHVDTSMPSWPRCLKENGYRTALIGKWHCGHEKKDQHPLANGYERFHGWLKGPGVSRDPEVMVDGEKEKFPGEYTSDVLADLAIETISEWKDEPFAVSMHFWAPHANTGFPEDFNRPYPGRDQYGKPNRSWLPMKEEDLSHWQGPEPEVPDADFPNQDHDYIRRMMREYLASVHSVDRNVGRVLEVLKELDIVENTIVVFTSDQGYNMGHNGIWHKGNGWWTTKDGTDPAGVYIRMTDRGITERENLYDTSLRVPGIVRWPDRIQPGIEIHELVSCIDWFPTLLEMTDTPFSENIKLQGRSVLSLLENPDNMLSEKPHFAQHHRLRCIRTAGWKYVLNCIDDEPDELYDLKQDPHEHTNLISRIEEPELNCVYTDLKQQLIQHMQRISDPLLKEIL